jgi:Bacterial protein of unknown function (DUF839)/Secretion system C-terminal sorting domain
MKDLNYAVKTCFFVSLFLFQKAQSQTIGTFNSVTPGTQTQSLVIPATHTFQRIIKSGDALTAGGTLAANTDFTGYVPIAGSSRNGYLSISGENTVASVATMTVSYDGSTHTWLKSNSGNVTFPGAAFGSPTPVSRFCSGTVTPNGTIMVSEESLTGGDTNGDGYEDIGWIIEIDPATRTVIESDAAHAGVDKLWAIGRQSRENVVIAPDNQTLYTGADDPGNGFVYKFIATTPGNFSSGQLYVLVTTGALGTGTWKLIANTTQADRNGTVALSTAAPAAYNFNGVEDIEIKPSNGDIYFTAKGPGRVYRFTDNGTTVSNLQVFVENTTYDVDPGAGVSNASWGIGNDNLAFDGEENLWVLQDGGNNHIWVVGPTHTAGTPAVRLFGKTPSGSEPTGITFTPDYRFMFISIQHPSTGNTASQTDAAGASVTFNAASTLVIARVENLGPLATLPLSFSAFNVTQSTDGVNVKWSVENVNNHDYFSVERSINGTDYEEIYKNDENINGNINRSFSIVDNSLPFANIIYYRIKQCDINGGCRYSDVKTLKVTDQNRIGRVYPQPVNDKLNIQYVSNNDGPATITVADVNGKTVLQEKRNLIRGTQLIAVNTGMLSSGMYLVTITDKNSQKISHRVIKE